jgi:hypothetical protein
LFVISNNHTDDKNRVDRINNLIDLENYISLESTYQNFTKKVTNNKQRLLDIINSSKLKVIGYGAAAKGVVMSNYIGKKINYIVDENPLKIGKVIGGVDIPIVGPDALLEEPDDLTIIVYAWNFYDEVLKKIKILRPNNNDVIVPSLAKNYKV